MGLSPLEVTYTSDIVSVLSKELLDVKPNIECGFSVKYVRDMIITCGQMHRRDKYLQQSSII